jgi:3'(2'), 5'-bisphosphate nucleotidase
MVAILSSYKYLARYLCLLALVGPNPIRRDIKLKFLHAATYLRHAPSFTSASTQSPQHPLISAMDTATRNSLAVALGQMACDAGEIIMKHRSSAAPVRFKPNGSPVSSADTEAESGILSRLSTRLPGVRIIAEESADVSPVNFVGERFVLVDPLDGTREFIDGRDEFTVNIAMIESGVPVAGCVYAPALQWLYVAGAQAWRCKVRPGATVPSLDSMPLIAVALYSAAGYRAVVSRSHLDPESEAMLDRLNITARRAVGSSLKFCLIAQGDADLYPRLGPTMEWDTAAGHAVLAAAGGRVAARDGKPLRYGKPGFRNDGFVAWGGAPPS